MINRKCIALAIIAAGLASPALAGEKSAEPTTEDVSKSAAAPQWYLDEIAFMTRDGGRWVASNAEYQSDDEPFEAYGLVWEMDYANSITGRLFGIKDGEETGDFWRFRQYWNAHEGRAIMQQFGFGGAIGVGTMWNEDGVTKMDQKFFGPDGVASNTGHIARNDGEKHITASYNIVDGEWVKDREYTWERTPAPAED